MNNLFKKFLLLYQSISCCTGHVYELYAIYRKYIVSDTGVDALTRVKSSAQREIIVAKSKQGVSADVSDHRLKFLRKHSVTIIWVFLTVAICSVYLQVKDHQFINFDDDHYVTENSHVLSGLNLENIKWAFTSVYESANWHPLTWISHMMDVRIFGMNPGMHHLTNVIFHVLNSILLLIVLNKMTGALWRSAAVATLFALHPLHVESVAWIAERKDVLSTFFWMLTMLAYHRYVVSRTISKYLLMILFFGLGLMAKPMLVTLPFVLLLLDFWPLKREELNLKINPQRLILEKVPLMIMALAASRVTFYAQSVGGSVISLERVSFASRIQNVIISYVAYLWKMVWPLNLAVFYPYPKQFNILTVVMCLLLLIAITVIVLMSARRLPYLVMGWFWYLGTLVPVIGIVQVGIQSMADRYTYIPLIGIFVMVAWGIPELLDKWQLKKIALATLTGIVIPILIVCSWIQVGYWKNSNILFEHALEVTVNNYLAHTSLASTLIEQGDLDGAIKHCTEALRINPKYTYAYNNMGRALRKKGDIQGSIEQYKQSLKINPHFIPIYLILGRALVEEKHYNEAVNQFQECLKIDPQNCDVYNSLGNIMQERGNLDDAIKYYMKALQIDPHQERVYYNLGIAYNKKGNIKKAIGYFEDAIREKPGYVEAINNLKTTRKLQKDYEDSILRIQEVLKTEPQNVVLITKLGGIYRQQGECDKAITQYQKAISIQPNFVQAMYGLITIYSDQKNYTNALNLLQKIRQIQPDNPDVYYNIACIYAKQNMTDESINSLKQSIDKGFHNWDLIKNDPDLANIRNTAFINELLKNH